jgi:hypothetical protein
LYGLTEQATVLDFLRANPAEFWSHILFNVTRIQSVALLALGAVTAAVTCVRVAGSRSIAIKIPFNRLIPLALFYVPAIAAIAIIYAKPHYFVIPYLVSIYLKGNTVWVRHYEIKDGESLEACIARVSPVIIISDEELHQYFVQKRNLPASFTREDMNSLIRSRGYEDYKCRTPAPDVFVAKNLPAR